MNELIGSKEASRKLKVTPQYLRMLCKKLEKREKLEGHKIGRDWMFPKERIQELVEKLEKKKQPLTKILKC